MGELKIGRAGLDIDLDNPGRVDRSGHTGYTLTGDILGATVAESKALERQLRGHVGTVQPVTWSTDSYIDGYYLVKDVKVSTRDTSYAGGEFDFSVTLEAVAGGAQSAQVQLHSFGLNRASATGTPQSWVAQPSAADAQLFTGNTGLGNETRTGPGPLGASGSVLLFVSADDELYDSYNYYSIAPGNFYDMGCFLFVDGEVFTDDQVPSIGNTTDWQINNGLLKVEPGSTGMFKITCPDSSPETSWSSVSMEFSPQWYNTGLAVWGTIGQGTTPPSIDTVKVRRNEAHEVTVRLVSTGLLTNRLKFNIDLTLRRGSRTLEVEVSQYLALPLGLIAHSGTWTNGSTQVMWESADNADGNRYAMFSTKTRDSANRRMGTVVGDINQAYFGVCGVVAGNSATGNNAVDELRDQYGAQMRETLKMVEA